MARGRKLRVRRNPKDDMGKYALPVAGIGVVVVVGYLAYSTIKGGLDIGKKVSDLMGQAGDYVNKAWSSLASGAGKIPGAAWDAIKSVNPWAYKPPAPPTPPPSVTYFVPTEDFIAQFMSGGKVVAQQSFKTQDLAQQYIDLNKTRYKNGDTWQIVNAKTGARIVGGVISMIGVPDIGPGEIIPGVSKKYMAQIIHGGKVVAIQESDDLDAAHKFINANIGNKAWKPGTWQILDMKTGTPVDSGKFSGLDSPIGRYVLGQYIGINDMIYTLSASNNPIFYESLGHLHNAQSYVMGALALLER